MGAFFSVTLSILMVINRGVIISVLVLTAALDTGIVMLGNGDIITMQEKIMDLVSCGQIPVTKIFFD